VLTADKNKHEGESMKKTKDNPFSVVDNMLHKTVASNSPQDG
jgi:hypothetical protein